MTMYFVDYGIADKFVIIFRLEGVKSGPNFIINSGGLIFNNLNKETTWFDKGDRLSYNTLNTAHQVIEMIFEVIYK